MNIGEKIRDILEKIVTDDMCDLSALSSKAEDIEKERDELVIAINEAIDILNEKLLLVSHDDECDECSVIMRRVKARLLNGKD